jgi:hypothetical protein
MHRQLSLEIFVPLRTMFTNTRQTPLTVHMAAKGVRGPPSMLDRHNAFKIVKSPQLIARELDAISKVGVHSLGSAGKKHLYDFCM